MAEAKRVRLLGAFFVRGAPSSRHVRRRTVVSMLSVGGSRLRFGVAFFRHFGAKYGDEGQIPILPFVVQAVADHKLVGDFKSDIVERHVD